MEDKLHNFFSENEFDFHEPHSGHMQRFEKRLQGIQPKRKFSWAWMSVAASIVLLIGFSLGKITNNEEMTLAKVSPKMQEVETYFVNTINTELQEIEQYRSLETEKIIERSLDKLEELEDNYKLFLKELNNDGDHRRLINQMINNYQKRLDILQSTLDQIEQVKKSKNLEDETFI